MPLYNDEVKALASGQKTAGGKFKRKAGVVVTKTALDIVRDGKLIARAKFSEEATGATATSISHTKQGAYEAEIGPTTYYAKFVEDGTSRMAAKPFMTPAAERNQEPFAQALANLAEEMLS